MDKTHLHNNAEIVISLPALENNLKVIKRNLGGDQKIMAVIKANAYGHGDIETARFLSDKVAWFAVNTVQEGMRLRDAGITNPFLVFGVPETAYSKQYRSYNLTATISDLSHFHVLAKGTKYHINIDTGMGRLGILPDEISKALELTEAHNELTCTGLYTHFATADDPDSKKVMDQLRLFNKLRQQFPEMITIHAANSGGVFFYPETHFDMVRSGIGIYGYAPGETAVEGLVPVLRLQSKIAQIKSLQIGETVSYGAGWKAEKKTNIAVVPVGYEDGLRRNLSGNLNVRINQKLYPVVGTITMNFCMVNLGSDDYEINTPVEILNGGELSVAGWAKHLKTISYELLTGLSKEIPRRYEN